jgi:uncharacterized protein YacL (UPF0231 family)
MYKIRKQQMKNYKHEEVQRWFKTQIKQVVMNLETIFKVLSKFNSKFKISKLASQLTINY